MTEQLRDQMSASLAYEKLKKCNSIMALKDAIDMCDSEYRYTWDTPAHRTLAGALRDELQRVMDTFAKPLAEDLAKKTAGMNRPVIVEISND